MTAPTLLELLDASRIFALRTAIVTTLKSRMPCEVKAHPGRLDADDVMGQGEMFGVPSLNVGLLRIDPAEGRMSGYRDVPAEISVYVVTADQAVGARGLVTRDELGFALCDGVLALLEDPAVSRWGLADIGPAENAAAMPLFTSVSKDRGTAYYAVTWRQILYTLGHPFADFEGEVPSDAAIGGVLLPGDPGWTPPPAGSGP